MEKAPADPAAARDPAPVRARRAALERQAAAEQQRAERRARGEPEPINPATYGQLWELTQERWARLGSPGGTAMALPLGGEDGWLFRDAYSWWEQIRRSRRSKAAVAGIAAKTFARWPDPRKLSPEGCGAGARVVLGWLLRNNPWFEVREEAGAIWVRARRLEGEGDHCVRCGVLLEQPKTGRHRRYCSERCRRAAEFDLRRTTQALHRIEAYDPDRKAKQQAVRLALMEERNRLCKVCRATPSWRARRCRACYAWWDRHGRKEGKERPPKLLERAARGRNDATKAKLLEEADRYADEVELPESLRQALAEIPGPEV